MPSLPPAVHRAFEILAEQGPLTAEALSAALLTAGFVQSATRLQALPARYPDAFAVASDGRLAAVLGRKPAGDRPDPDDEPAPTWSTAPPLQRVAPAQVALLDIETTGLDFGSDEIWELAAVALDRSRSLRVRVAVSDALRPRLPTDLPAEDERSLAAALEALDDFLAGIDVLAGQNVRAFDLPFLRRAAVRAGTAWDWSGDVVDLLDASLVVAPSLPGRSLADLCAHFGVDPGTPHRALDDAVASAEVLTRLIDLVDPNDATWQLVAAALDAGEHPLVRLLPPIAKPDDLVGAVSLHPDPLLTVGATGEATTAREAGWKGLRALHEEHGLQPRRAQDEMAEAVGEVLDHGGRLVVEAPTGTGKTFAYLLPAGGRASTRKPVVLTTATKALQQQLRRDADFLRERGLLSVPFRQLQGVANYICPRELADQLESADGGPMAWLALAVAVRALATSPTGVWDDVSDFPIADAAYRQLRGQLRTTAAECERQLCAWNASCPLMHRLHGIDRQPGVISANHALIASWVRLSRNGRRAPGDVLADGRADLVFDEAHNLEDSLTSAWTERLDGLDLRIALGNLKRRRGPVGHARSVARALEREPESLRQIHQLTQSLEDAADRLDSAARTYVHEYGGEQRATTVSRGLTSRRSEFRDVAQAGLVAMAILGKLQHALRELAGELSADDDVPTSVARRAASARRRLWGLAERFEEHRTLLESLRTLPDDHLWVHRLTVETRRDGDGWWVYERLPIHIGPAFAHDVVDKAHSVTLTSATLTVEGTFDFLGDRLGVRVEPGSDEPGTFEGRRLSTPFDYEKQSVVVLTNHLPVPVPITEREFCEDLAADQAGFLSLTGGRTLTLFAARRRMEAVAQLVRDKAGQALQERGVELLVQGEHTRREIARRFQEEPGTALYGLRSYWEGFDAPGETLSYLVIEKPPYPVPTDPLIAARSRALSDAGRDPFREYQLPLAAILLTQGFGRLIRSETDRGAALVCDRRLHSPGIARRVLIDSLPGPAVHESVDRDDAWRTAIAFVTGEEPDLSTAITVDLDDLAAALTELRLLPGEDPAPKLAAAAERFFGIAALRPEQLELMTAFLAGRDAIGILPTGSGKSLCFQVPALLHPDDGTVVVVSPLVALIKDQVDDLRARRGLRPVQGLTGAMSGVLRTEVLRDVGDGRIRLLYVSPERFVKDRQLRAALERAQLNGIAIDEAHSISFWGMDFRPEYRFIPKAAAELRRSPRLALTATATPGVEADVTQRLALHDPLVVRTAADRPNLHLRVVRCTGERARARELLRIAVAMQGKPGIVYVSRRAVAEEVAALLRRAELRARHYHAGMVPEQREAVQEDFFSDVTQIVVATKAFGMGINKPDVGWVVHYDLPESLDGYTQEAGRAARDPRLFGLCVLLYTAGDIKRRRSLLSRPDAGQEIVTAKAVLRAVQAARLRGLSRVFDPGEIADSLGIDADALGVILARLEDLKVLEREPDCAARGMVASGLREPTDEAGRRRFQQLFATKIRLQPHVRKQVDLHKLEDEHGEDPDALEELLIDWSLDRLITWHATQVWWRVRLLEDHFDEQAYVAALEEWTHTQRAWLEAMIRYADGARCRRAAIATYFGDDLIACDPARQDPCDLCLGSAPCWQGVPDALVPDPEELVNVDLDVLRAVAWASRSATHRYGESGLKRALLGVENYPTGAPLGAGLLGCPQFGALRFVRGAQRRLDDAIDRLLEHGYIERQHVEGRERSYASLVVTVTGLTYLGGTR